MNAVQNMVEEAEVSSEVWVSEGSRSPASQMIEKLRDKSGYLLETKAVSMTSEQENNSQELALWYWFRNALSGYLVSYGDFYTFEFNREE